MKAPYMAALQNHLELHYSSRTQKFARNMAADYLNSYGCDEEHLGKVLSFIQGAVLEAETYYINPRVMRTLREYNDRHLEELGESFKAGLEYEDLPHHAGYIYFGDSPIRLPSPTLHSSISIRAILWACSGYEKSHPQGLVMVPELFQTVDREQDSRLIGPVIGQDFRSHGGHAYSPLGPEEGAMMKWVTRVQAMTWSITYVFMLYIQQRLAYSVDKRPMSRGARKRLGHWKHEPTVKVVQLRAMDPVRYESPGDHHVDWQCRWEVRGHYRTYKSGLKVWINPYVKGPADKPLREYQDTVFNVSR